ncbi:MAG: serine hydrolase, partial [Chloroflexota bacterium]
MQEKSAGRKILIGCGWILATAVLLIGLTTAFNWYRIRQVTLVLVDILAEPAYATGLNTPESVLDFLEAHQENVSLVSYTVAPDGTAVNDETQIYHNADEQMPLASTKKILVLAAYAQAVAEGDLEPETAVSLADWQRFHLPGTNGGAHLAALEVLGIEIDEFGFAADPSQTVTLDQIVFAMIEYSDNAAPDYLIDLLGTEAINAIVTDAGFTPHPILPHIGLILTWQNHEQPRLTNRVLNELTGLSKEVYAARVWEMNERYLNSAWGESEIAWRRDVERPQNIHRLEQEAATRLDSTGSANLYAQIMAGVITETFISPEVSVLMKGYLEWPMAFSSNQNSFEAMGTKGGSLLGIKTEATYFVPKSGDFSQQPRVVVLFMRDMPFGAWIRLSQTFAQQGFQNRLA